MCSLSDRLGESGPILVVEDDAQVRALASWVLEDEGFNVVAVADGRAAIEAARDRRPALILLDWTLPGANGDSVAAELRKLYDDAIPIVLMTSDGRVAQKAARVGAVACFHKPFDVDTLLSSVHQALE